MRELKKCHVLVGGSTSLYGAMFGNPDTCPNRQPCPDCAEKDAEIERLEAEVQQLRKRQLPDDTDDTMWLATPIRSVKS